MKGFVSGRLHPFTNLLLLVGLLFAAFCIAGFVIGVLGNLFFGVPMLQVGNVTSNPSAYPEGWGLSMLSQGVLLFVTGVGAALALVRLTGYSWQDYFAPRRPVPGIWLVGAAAIVLASLPLMSGLVEWNAGLHLPKFLEGVEKGARELEDRAQELTKYLTQFTSPARFLVGLVVVAVVPAISEELVFRGIIQRNLVRWCNAKHTGVWLGAAVFSAIHFQFFGFVPRFVLGLILGYLYEWSGNIVVPMVAHFTQNAFQLVLLYAQQRGALAFSSFDPESTEALPWWLQILSLMLMSSLLWVLFHNMTQPSADPQPTQLRTLSGGGVATVAPDSAALPAGRTLSHDGVDISRQQDS